MWLESTVGERASEFGEILGYHLAEAYLLHAELGSLDAHAAELGRRAAELLGVAARRAIGRSDMNAARALLERAVAALSVDDAARAAHELELAETLLYTRDIHGALELIAAARASAEERGDAAVVARSRVLGAYIQLFAAQISAGEARTTAQDAIPILESLGDDYWLARAWRVTLASWNYQAQYGSVGPAALEALVHARRCGDGRSETEATFRLCASWFYGPAPVADALERCADVRADVSSRMLQAYVDIGYGGLQMHAGLLDEARTRIADARVFLRELGDELTFAGTSLPAALVELAAGDPAAAESMLSPAYAMLHASGDHAFLSTIAGLLADAVYRQGRLDEAETFARESEAIGGADDRITQMYWRTVLAKVFAIRGEYPAAERLAREAVDIVRRTDALAFHGDALLTLAEVLHLADRLPEAAEAASEAIGLYSNKGSVQYVALAKRFIERIS